MAMFDEAKVGDRLLKFMVTFGGTVVAYEWLEDDRWKCEKLNARITDILPAIDLGHKVKRWQFIGLFDKNGGEIYDNHKLKDKDGEVWTVKWSKQGENNVRFTGWVIVSEREVGGANCTNYGFIPLEYEIVGHVAIVEGRKLKIAIKTPKPKKSKRKRGK